VLRTLDPERFAGDGFGLPTVTDILAELEKPGRDPRPAFRTASFTEGVDTIEDLRPGMLLEGVVSNVAAFGAFVDVGVHHDGLVHVSAMSRTFVRDPREVVKPGDIVRVKVLDVDIPRKRISLTLRLDDDAEGGRRQPGAGRRERGGGTPGAPRGSTPRQRRGAPPDTALADALRRAGLDKGLGGRGPGRDR
jgi:protein Tex